MVYNNGFPVGYYPQYNYIPQQQVVPQPVVVQQPVVQQANENGILWVQGEAGAKSFAVAPGKSVMLMDSESNTFYIKSSDNSGMPMPLRVFDYTERTSQQQPQKPTVEEKIDTSQFVTWDDFKRKINEIFVNQKKEVVIDA